MWRGESEEVGEGISRWSVYEEGDCLLLAVSCNIVPGALAVVAA